MHGPPVRAASHTFFDFHGGEAVYNGRRPLRDEGAFGTFQQFDSRVGHALAIAGRMPVIVPRAGASPTILRLLRRAGVRELPPLFVYEGRESYEQLLKQLADQRKTMVFQFTCGHDAYPESLFWIAPSVTHFLNDKASLPQLVPARNVPPRCTIPTQELDRLLAADYSSPLVLKGTGPWDRGSASAVAIVRDPAELLAARERLCRGSEVIQEAYLDVVRNYCVTFAAGRCGVRYLGTTEQVTGEDGRFLGNWLRRDEAPPEEAIEVGFEIMRRAVAHGYEGMAGFDMIVDRDERLWVIDLNFRLNASTGANLWREMLFASSAFRVARTHQWQFDGPLRAASHLVGELLDDGVLFPLKFFDPQGVGQAGSAQVFGLVFGHSREEVERTIERVAERLPRVDSASERNLRRAA